MRCGFITVGNYSGNFCFEQRNALGQFGLRIGREILRREFARSVAFGAGTIIVFHQKAASQLWVLAVNTAKR